MSTQKRENWCAPPTNTSRREPGCRSQRTPLDRAGGWDPKGLSHFARQARERVCGGTAPLWSIFWSAWAWLATKFLHKDQTYRHFVQPEFTTELSGSPPRMRACGRRFRRYLARQLAARDLPASPCRPASPLPSGFAISPPTLPHVPAHLVRAERHDGKRDLYLLYAA
jgi:hypothetical protein